MTAALVARANVANLLPRFDSNAEAWWDTYGAPIIADELGCAVTLSQFHPLTFHLPGGNYTPDFLHILTDGRLVLVEVKGSQQQKNYRDARSKLRAAAAIYPWATWYEVRGCGGDFEMELIEEETWAG